MKRALGNPKGLCLLLGTRSVPPACQKCKMEINAIGHIIDTHVIKSGSVIRTAVIFFYLSNEGISIIENAAHLGLPIPEKLKDVLEQLHDRSRKEEEE